MKHTQLQNGRYYTVTYTPYYAIHTLKTDVVFIGPFNEQQFLSRITKRFHTSAPLTGEGLEWHEITLDQVKTMLNNGKVGELTPKA